MYDEEHIERDFKTGSGRIQLARKEDAAEILALYRSMIGGKADWNEEYPSAETIEFDLSRNSLFVIKNDNDEIISAISIDEDPEVDSLDCWNKELQPSGEISRICVRKDMQNKGIAREMIQFIMEVLIERGMKGIRFLVRPQHSAAIKSYSHLGFHKVGECFLFDKEFLCYEKQLYSFFAERANEH